MADLADAYVYEESSEVPLADLPDFLRQGLDYWKSVKGDRVAPPWADFDLLALPTALIPFVIVIDVKQPLGQSVYRFWGTGHVDAKGIDRTAARVEGHPHGRSAVVVAEYAQVLERGAPMAFRRDVRLPDPRPMLTQVSLRLPLSSDGEHFDHIVSCCDWLSLKDHWKSAYALG